MIEPLDSDDTTRCPLCGQANECAIAAGRDAESCWCMNVIIDTAALASIPPEARGKVCICVRCASGTTAAS
ncbi:MAG: cysteine-rich CWC family protein [Myxococcales bacterium]|nr:cysteine-rich CWC family protein [Myxococcales bacterium]